MKKIIVAMDFLPEAENAQLFASSAAVEHGFELVLFMLYNPSVVLQIKKIHFTTVVVKKKLQFFLALGFTKYSSLIK